MPASQPANFNLQEFSDAGLLLFGGRLYTYAYGTTAQKTAYTDPAGTIPHTYTADGAGGQYIALNARGELPAPLYLAPGAYDLALKRGDGSTVWARRAEPVGDGVSALAASIGSSLIGFIQAGAGAILRTVQSKLRESPTVADYGAVGDGVADDTASIQAALTAMAAAGGGIVTVPPGIYKLTAKITVPSYVMLRGPQWVIDPSNTAGATKGAVLSIGWGATQDNHAVEMSHSSGIEGFSFYYPGQAAKNAATPIAFGFSISTPTAAGVYDNIHVKNINLYNSYKGIRLNNGGRWRVENVQGNPLLMGFTASNCYDACYMRAVHFWNFYTQADTLETWVSNNGTAFEFWRIDQLFADGLFGWNYWKCFDCKDGAWLSLSNILCDKAAYPFTASNSATINVSNFVLISNASGNPAIWVKANANSVRFSNGVIQNTASVGAQIDDTSIVNFDNIVFSNQHCAVVVTSETSDVYIDNSKWAVPPFGSSNVRVNGERLPNRTTAVALPAPIAAPTAIAGGFQFDLSTAGAKTLQYETTYISQRNSLFVLEADWEMVGISATWYFQMTIQTDAGASTQVAFAPLYPMLLNGTSGAAKKVRIPFFINHGRFKQVLNIIVTPTVTVPGASLKLTNIALYEQGNKFTSDSQVSNMMASGYNLDAYGMGQTLMAKGKNRIVLTQSEAGIGRATEVPTSGTWDVGDEVRVYSPAAGGYIGYVCTTAGTPGMWKGTGSIAP